MQRREKREMFVTSVTDYAAELETRLTALISRVEGAGKTAVMVTLESGSESVYAIDTDSDGSSTHVLLGSGMDSPK
jgi:stage III sporulation protein AG